MLIKVPTFFIDNFYILIAVLLFLFSGLSMAKIIRTPYFEGMGQTPLEQIEQQIKKYPDIFYVNNGETKKNIALTFDDGPSEYTEQLLGVLKKYNVKATFFWMGSQMENHPEIVQLADEQGHTIANHTYTHARSTELENYQFWNDEVERTQKIMQAMLNYRPAFYRPPYGDITDEQIELLGKKGMKIIGWTIDTFDWFFNTQDNGLDEIKKIINQNLHPGAVIMMHDGGRDRSKTVSAIEQLIPEIQSQGYSFMTMDEMLGLDKKLPLKN